MIPEDQIRVGLRFYSPLSKRVYSPLLHPQWEIIEGPAMRRHYGVIVNCITMRHVHTSRTEVCEVRFLANSSYIVGEAPEVPMFRSNYTTGLGDVDPGQ